eukprot:TRINITY_DN73929_c0_g1_i1.p1 TRINITY_DN73929_c0_g1~~TRINITY_DN73929_c0_g1_i1.p1  ORF type:complete len:307 (-),score=98.45 TRINITY_DN73929_c0_g1_i1:222-1142(-)
MGNKNSAADAKMKAKEWQWKLKMEVKHLDKEIKKIEADEGKIRREIQAQAQKGNVPSVQLLAKSIVKSRKAVQRLERTKASMHAVVLQLTTSIATMSTTQSLRISADCMKNMNALSRLPELGGTMEAMRKEMARCAEAEDGIEELFHDEDEAVEAATEVQRVLEEMALDMMGPLARAAVPAAPQPVVEEPPAVAQPPQRQLVAESAMPAFAPPARPQAAAPAAKPAPTESPVQPEAPPPASATPPPAAPTASPPTAPTAPPPAAPAEKPAAQPPVYPAASSPPPEKGAITEEDEDLLKRLQRLKQG